MRRAARAKRRRWDTWSGLRSKQADPQVAPKDILYIIITKMEFDNMEAGKEMAAIH